VLTPPPDLDESEVARLTRGAWGLPVSRCRYLAEGMGSHHWLGSDVAGTDRWFITADRVRTSESAEELQACFRIVQCLADRLPFVLGPQLCLDGSITVPTGRDGSLLLSVRDYLPGQSGRFGEFTDPEVRFDVLRALGKLHSLPVPDLLPRWQPATYAGIRSALTERNDSWKSAGPFAEAARQLVQVHADTLTRRLDAFAAASTDLLSHREDVISHGEPHAANVLVLAPTARRSANSRIALLDWDTVRAAPRERDLAVALPDGDGEGLAAALDVYLGAAGAVERSDHEVIALFREEWALNDIDVYLRELRAPHGDTADTQAALHYLEGYATSGT
jgi:spectinomycin phosphotransferase